MKVIVCQDTKQLGKASAAHAAACIREAVETRGSARILLSTGASQFPFFESIAELPIEWDKVEVFHLDEYVGISPDHPASFHHYLQTRFVDKVHPGKVHLIDGRKPVQETIAELTALLAEKPVDLGMIGIGENAHIAFNDPPADFEDPRAYKVVTLAERCLQQQVGEGWFPSTAEAYKQAISMTCSKIMECRTILCVVPYKVKAEAIANTLREDVNPQTPATLLKKHADCTVYCDPDSASLAAKEDLEKYR